MSFDHRDFRNALGNFATGVTIVTARTRAGEALGLTANSFNSVSLDPPLVLFSLNRQNYSLRSFEEAGNFAINVLRDDQQEISRIFATALTDKWQGLEYETWDSGAPILSHALAVFDCATHAVHDGGDHLIFVGKVLRFAHDPKGRPLLYFRGNYGQVHPDP
jgi:flavin reductase (DIM6/NTAB) family NADH-FMN oxidoreductase RutF